MRVEEILGRLKGVRESGDGSWVACCPAHDDSNPSMSVTVRNGKILLHCHAGCQASEIVAAMGLEMKDLFEDDSLPAGKASLTIRLYYCSEERTLLTEEVNGYVKEVLDKFAAQGISLRS